MPTAILIDGAFFIKRFRNINPRDAYDAEKAVAFAMTCAFRHLEEDRAHGEKRTHELYRIFFYDCPPLSKKAHNPISKQSVDFSKSKEAIFRNELHNLLRKKRKVALRLGHLSEDSSWTIKPAIIADLLRGKKQYGDLTADDVQTNVRQKGVDMRIGIDITSLAMKKQARQIVLIAGDADFVPAAKLARREGVDFILDPMWQPIPANLHEHIDGLRSTCPNPEPEKAKVNDSARTLIF